MNKPILARSAFLLTALSLCAATAQAQTYYRLQLKSDGQYLDADHCGSPVTLNPGSSYAGGACQAWRFVAAGGGWYKIQLKANGQYLDADHCTTKLALNPGSTYAGGDCQLWRLVPMSLRID